LCLSQWGRNKNCQREETEPSLEIQKYKISCRVWGEAVTYSKFTSSNKYLKTAGPSTTATVLMTFEEKTGKALNWIWR